MTLIQTLTAMEQAFPPGTDDILESIILDIERVDDLGGRHGFVRWAELLAAGEGHLAAVIPASVLTAWADGCRAERQSYEAACRSDADIEARLRVEIAKWTPPRAEIPDYLRPKTPKPDSPWPSIRCPSCLMLYPSRWIDLCAVCGGERLQYAMKGAWHEYTPTSLAIDRAKWGRG